MKWSTLNRLCVVAGAAAVLTVAALLVLVLSAQPTVEQEDEELPAVYDKPATLEASERVTVSAARTDGVLYDLPSNIHQAVTCDRNNREYMVLWTDEGGLTIEPILEADGTPAFMPQM